MLTRGVRGGLGPGVGEPPAGGTSGPVGPSGLSKRLWIREPPLVGQESELAKRLEQVLQVGEAPVVLGQASEVGQEAAVCGSVGSSRHVLDERPGKMS